MCWHCKELNFNIEWGLIFTSSLCIQIRIFFFESFGFHIFVILIGHIGSLELLLCPRQHVCFPFPLFQFSFVYNRIMIQEYKHVICIVLDFLPIPSTSYQHLHHSSIFARNYTSLYLCSVNTTVILCHVLLIKSWCDLRSLVYFSWLTITTGMLTNRHRGSATL